MVAMRLGIRARFSLFILGSVMLILSSTMISTLLVIRQFSIEDARDFSLTILEETNTKITTFVTEVEYLARSLSEYRVVREMKTSEFRDLFLSQVLPRRRYIRAIYVGTAAGEMWEYGQGPGFVDFAPNLPDDYDPRTRPWYQAALTAGGFTVSDPYLYASYPLLGITGAIPVYARPAYTAAGSPATDRHEIVGVLGVDIVLDDLRNVLVDLRIPKDGRALLLDDNGRVIASQFAGDAGDARDSAAATSAEGAGAADGIDDTGPESGGGITLPEMDEHIFSRIATERIGSFITEYRGRLMVLSHTVNPATGWYLVLALPYRAIMEPGNSVLRFMAILDLVLIVILLLTIRVFSNRLVLRPIEEIVQTVNRVHAGDRAARVDLQRDDEIGLLAREFNQLVSAVGSYTEDMEAEVERRTREVRDLEQENSRLRLVEERERIYRDLHDSLGAQLTNISICAAVARNSPGAGDSRTTEMIERIDENARIAIEGLRETILGEPDFSSFSGIVDRIEQMADRRLSLKGISLVFDHRTIESGRPVPPEVGESLYRVCEELITNVQKHSQAKTVICRITRERELLALKCSDDGVGFDPDGDHRGFGLKNMAKRVEATGGMFDVTATRTGTTIACEFPLVEGRS